MVTISTTYNIDYTLKNYDNYGVTDRGIVINLKRCKILKRTVVGYSKGYYIEGKFITLTKLRTMLVKKPKIKCPF
jgi:hypothetical protein